MARKASELVARVNRSQSAAGPTVSPEDRQRMIEEAAYYRYVQRGFANGHDLEDWLAAEAELDEMNAQQAAQSGELEEFEAQQSGVHGFRRDEALKRIIRQHPQRGITQVEGIEPQEAPAKK
ncbi:MAG: DUF2934 domain-containing protein [Thiobacillaceae bacterium]